VKERPSGSIRPSPDGLSFTYRPSFGYGRGPSNITVTLTTAIADRSGNVLDKGLTVRFVSEFDPFAPSYQEVLEDFVTNTKEDKTFFLASTDNGRAIWNGKDTNGNIVFGAPAGSLQASYGTGTKELNFNAGSWVSPPWYSLNMHTQMLYTSAQMGKTARTISGHAWHNRPGNSLTTGTYAGTTVKRGHNTSGTLNTTYNFTVGFSDTPVTVFNNQSYVVSNSLDKAGWITGPAHAVNWPYNGNDNIILDINVANSGGPYNQCALGSTGSGGIDFMTTGGGGSLTFTSQNIDMRFLYLVDKSEAQSLFYDTAVQSPTYLGPIVVQSKPAGTVITMNYQGARPDPIVVGQIDPNSYSAWTTDPQLGLSGYRYIRFNVAFQSNLSSGTKPQIDSLTMPFIYF